MAEFLVSGYYGPNNAGDEAILAGMIRSIRDLNPEATFTVISKKAAFTRSVHGVNAVSRNDFKGTWRAIADADLLISGGGSLLQDVTSTKSLLYYLWVISLGRIRRTPTMIYSQGIGPINRIPGKVLVPTVLGGVDLITVRDKESAGTLRTLGVKRPPTYVTADSALSLGPSDPERGAALLRQGGVDLSRPLIGVSVRPWTLVDRPWEPALARALDDLSRETGATVAFIPLMQPDDVRAAETVAGLMQEKPVLLHGDMTHVQVQAMVARCDLLIGMRYHALVFAAMNGVPLVGLSYDPKTDSFVKLMGEEVAGQVARLESESVLRAARRALSEAPQFRQRLLNKVAELTPLSRRNAQLALELLEHRRSKR